MKSLRWVSRFSFLALLASTPAARAQVISGADCLPPIDVAAEYFARVESEYVQPVGVSIALASGFHNNFSGCFPPSDHGGPLIHGPLGSTINVDVSVNGGPFSHFTAPALFNTRVDLNHVSGNTRFFNTEMLQLDFSGSLLGHTIEFRESPTLASVGQTTITGLGGDAYTGPYSITSFFDIFSELSLDGGPFVAAETSFRAILMPVPEPSSIMPLAIGIAGLGVAILLRPRMHVW